jgi:hypothetical protein
MDTSKVVEIIKNTESPLKRQLLMVGLITRLLEEQGKKAPVVIGGCALSYYSREVPIPLNPAGCSAPKRPLVPIETGHLFVGAKRRWG